MSDPSQTLPDTRPVTPPGLPAAARERLPQMLADLQRLIEVETPSHDLVAVARGAEVVADLVEERLGRRPEPIVVQDCTHLRLDLGPGPRTVVLLCHQDTVWPTGTLGRLPFRTEAGVVRGPGSFDMLTGLVMGIHAVALLQEHGLPVGPDGSGNPLDGVTLLVTGDEEIGSTSSRDLILETSAGARGVLVLEASAPGGALKVGRKGGGIYTLRITGRAAHAGLEPEKGVSALAELAAQVPAITALADAGAGTSVTPTRFSGGTTTNTVPGEATVAIDTRARTMAELERVDAGLRALRPVLEGAVLALEGGINRPPLERPLAEGLLAEYVRVTREFDLPIPYGVEVGGCSDGNFTAGAGVPTLDGLGAVGDGAHAEHEHAVIAEIAPRTAVLAGLVAALVAEPVG